MRRVSLALLLVACEPAPKVEPSDSDSDSGPVGSLDSSEVEDCADPLHWYADQDGDGYGDDEQAETGCEAPEGYVSQPGDCDDEEPSANPEGEEEPYNRIDDDCDPATPDDDLDGDGSQVEGSQSQDCDDADPTVYPGAVDVIDEAGIDENCDGVDGDDNDGDGFASEASGGTDCNDLLSETYPGAPEECRDAMVNDCDGDAATATELCALPGPELSLGEADLQIYGLEEDYSTYPSVAGVGDLDGDGLADLLVGTPLHLEGSQRGAAWLMLGVSLAGAEGRRVVSDADVQLSGVSEGDLAGWSVAAAGDVDGDGTDDMLVGALRAAGGSGAAYLVHGTTALGASGRLDLSEADLRLAGEAVGDEAGISVSGDGDVNGDGLSDLVVGSTWGGYDAGAAYVVWEPIGDSLRDLSEADLILTGEAVYDGAGSAVSSTGDVDGDGLADLLVGARGHSEGVGAAYLVLATTATGAAPSLDLSGADLALVGEAALDYAGWSVCIAGDVDGDGLADLLVGAPYNDGAGDMAGAAYLVLAATVSGTAGALNLSSADLRLLGEDAEDRAGIAVAGAGDLDGDGLSELLVGAPYASGASWEGGDAYVMLGATDIAAWGSLSLADTDLALLGWGGAGWSVASAGDVNADGFGDLLIGASNAYSEDGDGYVSLVSLVTMGRY